MWEVIGGIALLIGCLIVWGLILGLDAREERERRELEEREAELRWMARGFARRGR
ncbi:MAG: hypothetical protein HKO53_02780 [Gemmatimonadetes bacterium]|nr:hypothetical protein [Gemmatimonadota bacterium]